MAQFYIGVDRKARRCYGFDEIALVPGKVTVNPAETDSSFEFAGKRYKIPIMASAMDGVVDVKFAVAMGKLGGIAVLNLEGVQTRYDNPNEVLDRIAGATSEEATKLAQSIYAPPHKRKTYREKNKGNQESGCPGHCKLYSAEGREVRQNRRRGGLRYIYRPGNSCFH